MSEEIGRLCDGATLISLIGPASHPESVEELARRPIIVLAMDAVPCISPAQSLDVHQLDGEHRRIPGDGRGRARLRPLLHGPGDRGPSRRSAPTVTPRRPRTATNRLAAQLYAEQAADVDIITTTALIPGRPAPKLITAEDVASMKPAA